MTILDSDDHLDFDDLFLPPDLEKHWKEHALYAEQHARCVKCLDFEAWLQISANHGFNLTRMT